MATDGSPGIKVVLVYRSTPDLCVAAAKRFLKNGLQAFKPDLVIVSAGYDALEADELATASLQPEDFGRMGRRLKEVFGRKVAFGLEGGYNLQVTPEAIRNTIEPFASSAA